MNKKEMIKIMIKVIAVIFFLNTLGNFLQATMYFEFGATIFGFILIVIGILYSYIGIKLWQVKKRGITLAMVISIVSLFVNFLFNEWNVGAINTIFFQDINGLGNLILNLILIISLLFINKNLKIKK